MTSLEIFKKMEALLLDCEDAWMEDLLLMVLDASWYYLSNADRATLNRRKNCRICGRPFHPRQRLAKYCGVACRQEARRRPRRIKP